MKKLFVLLFSLALSGCIEKMMAKAMCGIEEGKKIELCDEAMKRTVVFNDDMIGAYSNKRPSCLKVADDDLKGGFLDDQTDNNHYYPQIPNSDHPIEMKGVWHVDKVAYKTVPFKESETTRFWMVLTQEGNRVAVRQGGFETEEQLHDFFCGEKSKEN